MSHRVDGDRDRPRFGRSVQDSRSARKVVQPVSLFMLESWCQIGNMETRYTSLDSPSPQKHIKI